MAQELVEVVEVGISLSLTVIVGVLIITVLASLYSPKGRALRVLNGLQTVAEKYVTLPQDAPAEERRKLADKAAKYQRQMPQISDKHREELLETEKHFHELLDRARGKHREFERTGVGPTPDGVPDPEAEALSGARSETQETTGTTTPDAPRGGGSSAV